MAATGRLGILLRQLRAWTECDAEALTDGQLLERFAQRGEPAALETLVARHGPLVHGICRRLLRDQHDAEDVFQATFLVLVRRARALHGRDSLAAYLYTVARRLALRALADARRRRSLAPAPAPEVADPLDEVTARELLAALDEELARLPEKYRAPLVLCHLQGKTRDEAARELGWTPGALRGRLERGRARLHARLARRGLAPATLIVLDVMHGAARSALPAGLAEATVKAGLGLETPAGALALAEGGMRGLALGKAKLGLALLLGISVVLAGVGTLAHHAPAARPPAGPKPMAAAERPRAKGDERAGAAERHGESLPEGAVARLGNLRLRHPLRSLCIAYSPDGTILASGGEGDLVRLWDAATGAEVRRLSGNGARVQALAFSPDGKALATGTFANDRVIRLWEVRSGKLLRSFAGHPNGTYGLAFAPDGMRLLSIGGDGMVWLRESARGKDLLRFRAHKLGVTAAAFAPDGRAFATTGRGDAVVRLWDAATGKELRQFRGHPGWAYAVAFAPDGKTLAAGGDDNSVRLWAVATGKEVRRLQSTNPIRTVSFTADGKMLAAASWNEPDRRVWKGMVKVWDVASGKEVHQLEAGDNVSTVAFAPGGKILATDGGLVVRLWDLATGKERTSTEGHRAWVSAVGFAPDGKTPISVGDDNTVRWWDPATGKEVRQTRKLNSTRVRSWFTPGGRLLALESRFIEAPGRKGFLYCKVRLVGVVAGKERLALKVKHYATVACSADGGRLAAVDENGLAKVWEIGTGKEVCRWRAPIGENRLAFAPDGKTIAVNNSGITLHLHNAFSGVELRRFAIRGVGPVPPPAFAPDGKTLATAGVACLDLWDAATGARVRQLLQPLSPPGFGPIAFAPGGRTVAAVADYRDWFTLWDVQTGKVLGQLNGRDVGVRAFEFSPDGRTLALGVWDGTLRLWDAFTGQEIHRYRGHQATVTAVAFAPDGRRLLSGSADGTGLIWDLTGGIKTRAPSAKELRALWDDLGGKDAVRADRAFWTLAAAPKQAVALLRPRLLPARPAVGPRLRRLVADLDNDDFAERERSEAELKRLGDKAATALRRALAAKPSLEARRRIERLLARLKPEPPGPPPAVGQLRAARVLEQVGTPEARAVLLDLAAGEGGAVLAAEARAVLQRRARP